MVSHAVSSSSVNLLTAAVVLCILQAAALVFLFYLLNRLKRKKTELALDLQSLKTHADELNLLLNYIADLGKINYISGRQDSKSPDAHPVFKFIQVRSESMLPENKEEYLTQYRNFFAEKVQSFAFKYSLTVNGEIKQFCDHARFSDKPGTDNRRFIIATMDISELAKQTCELANTDTLLTAIFDNLPGYIVMKNISSDFAYLRCNNAFSSLLQMHPSEVVGKTDFDLFNRSLAQRIRFFDMQIAANHSIADNHWFFTTPDSKEHAMRFINRSIKRPDGSEIIIGFGLDITRQERLAGKLRKRNKELRLLLAQNNSRNMLLDNNLNLACAAPAMHELFAEELQAKESPVKCSDICQCGITDIAQCPAMEALLSGQTQQCKYAKALNSALQIKPLLNENNTAEYLAVSLADYTEQQEAEETDA